MTIVELVSGNWLECSGGSRPHSNNIRFWKAPDNRIWLEISYVFDWNTGETQTFGFELSKKDFDTLVDGILKEGRAELQKDDKNQSLHFEWKSTPSGFAFRLKGGNTSPFEGPAQVDFNNFLFVNCGKLSNN